MRQPTTLEEFIAPLSVALNHDAIPDIVAAPNVRAIAPAHITDVMSATQLTDRFAEEADKVRIHVHRCTRATIGNALAQAISEAPAATEEGLPAGPTDAKRDFTVVFADDPRMTTLHLEDALNAIPRVARATRWNPDAGEVACVEEARTADVGITFATAGIAETGTIAQVCNASCGRSVSLLPLTHIAVVEASTIVPSLLDVMEQLQARGGAGGRNLPSQVCFISGPSNTSDIELVRVEGVHGPMTVHYLLLED